MAEVTMYVIAINYHDRRVHRRVRERLRFYGDEVVPGMFEVFLEPRLMAKLRKALQVDAQDGDLVRIYPVCERCRHRATALGQDPFAEPPTVLIF